MIRTKIRADIDPRILDGLTDKQLDRLKSKDLSMDKTARSYSKSIKLQSAINQSADMVRRLGQAEEVSKKQAANILNRIRSKKRKFRGFMSNSKDWKSINTFRNLERQVINLKRKSEKL